MKYRIEYCFVSENQQYFGKVVNSMSFKDIDFMLKMISPLNYQNWISTIRCCPRFGSVILKTIENTELGIKIAKVYKFSRM